MSEVGHRPVAYHDETDEEAFASRVSSGAPAVEIRGWVSSYWAIRDGSLEAVSADVRRLTGAEPIGLRAYVTAHPEALDHVRPDGD